MPSSHGRIHGRSDTWENYTLFRKAREEQNLDMRVSMYKGTGARETKDFCEASAMSITSQKAVAAAET